MTRAEPLKREEAEQKPAHMEVEPTAPAPSAVEAAVAAAVEAEDDDEDL